MKLAPVLLFSSICLQLTAATPTFTFTRTDGTEWRCGLANVETPVLIASGQSPVGSLTNVYAGDIYWIDHASNSLIKNGQLVGVLWNGRTVWPELQTYWGFTVDALGNGWLISTDSAENDLDFLVWVDLKSGNIEFVDHIGTHDAARANGLVVSYPPARRRISPPSVFVAPTAD